MTSATIIRVACAIIEQDGLVLAAQRSAAMALPYAWEFPGGKLEPGESPEACLHRELREELGVGVEIARALSSRIHRYPACTVMLYPFVVRIVTGEIVLHEHAAIDWLPPERLHELDWLEADRPVIDEYLNDRASGGLSDHL